MKKKTRLLAVAAVAALIGLGTFAFSATDAGADTRAPREQHFAGLCRDCSWKGRVYDRYDPALEECRDHSDATTHVTEVETRSH